MNQGLFSSKGAVLCLDRFLAARAVVSQALEPNETDSIDRLIAAAAR